MDLVVPPDHPIYIMEFNVLIRGTGYRVHRPVQHGQIDNWVNISTSKEISVTNLVQGSHGTFLVKLDI